MDESGWIKPPFLVKSSGFLKDYQLSARASTISLLVAKHILFKTFGDKCIISHQLSAFHPQTQLLYFENGGATGQE